MSYINQKEIFFLLGYSLFSPLQSLNYTFTAKYFVYPGILPFLMSKFSTLKLVCHSFHFWTLLFPHLRVYVLDQRITDEQ